MIPETFRILIAIIIVPICIGFIIYLGTLPPEKEEDSEGWGNGL